MALGIRKKIVSIKIKSRLIRYRILNLLYGLEFANQYLIKTDKQSQLLILKAFGAKIGDNCDIETGLIFHNCTDFSNLTIGNNCHIGKGCFFDLRDRIIIDDNVTISMQSTFITHIDVGHSSLKDHFPFKKAPIHINSNTYIGARVTVLPGIDINQGAFVAAATLVNHDIHANQLVAGIPVKLIRNI